MHQPADFANYIARGLAEEARRIALKVLTGRFGALPHELHLRIETADRETCEELIDRALRAESVDELGR